MDRQVSNLGSMGIILKIIFFRILSKEKQIHFENEEDQTPFILV